MGQVIVNGVFLPDEGPSIPVNDRAFHYGDGLFESIRVIDGRPVFLEAHWTRLVESMKVLRIERPHGLDLVHLSRYITELARANNVTAGRCRLTVFRDSAGHYRPSENKGAFAIELHPLADPTYTLNESGLNVDIYAEMRKPVNVMAVHKTLNCLLYVMASLWSKERGLDDCLLQNDRGNIIESSSGNLFIVSNGVLYTPSLGDGCVGGVMRMQLINLALGNGIKVYECSLNPQNLLAADELLFTNAVRGIQWVATYRTKRYTHRMSQTLIELLRTAAVS